MRIAIPTNIPVGVEANRSEHFGKCDLFTVIELDGDNEFSGVETYKNMAHDVGGCMAPIKILQNADVDAM